MGPNSGARPERLIDPVTSEQFQELLGGCARALAGNSSVNLIFGVDGQKFSPAAARLAHRAPQISQRERTILRGQADLVGLYQAFHTPAIQCRLTALCASSDVILSMAEQARIEAIGSRRYAGVAANLAVMIDSHYLQEERIVAAEDTLQRRGLAVAAMLREVLAPAPAPRRRFMLVEAWRPQIQPSIGVHCAARTGVARSACLRADCAGDRRDAAAAAAHAVASARGGAAPHPKKRYGSGQYRQKHAIGRAGRRPEAGHPGRGRQ